MAKFTDANSTDYLFIRFDGEITTVAETIQEITRGFVNGVALKKRGIRGAPETITGIRDVKTVDLENTLDNYKALAGQFVTLTDNAGLAHTGVGIIRVPRPKVQKIVTPVGGIENDLGDWLIFQPFIIVDGSTAP